MVRLSLPDLCPHFRRHGLDFLQFDCSARNEQDSGCLFRVDPCPHAVDAVSRRLALERKQPVLICRSGDKVGIAAIAVLGPWYRIHAH
jgi:hypothetical protein